MKKNQFWLILSITLRIVFISLLATSLTRSRTLTHSNAVTCVVQEKTIRCSGTGELTSQTVKGAGTYETYQTAIIEDGCETIGAEAFKTCNALTSVTLPATTLRRVEDQAFGNCGSLREITFPSTLTYLASTGCHASTRLTHIHLTDNTGTYTELDGFILYQGNLYIVPTGRERGGHLILPSVPKILGGVYRWGTAKYITVPDEVTYIGGSAFYKCTAMINISIGRNVSNIEPSAFSSCSGLQVITVHPENTNFYNIADDQGAIFGKKNAQDEPDTILWMATTSVAIKIPSSVTTILDTAIQNCPGLISIEMTGTSAAKYRVICDGLLVIDKGTPGSNVNDGFNRARYCSGAATAIEIPSYITQIASACFRACNKLTEIILHADVTMIGGGAFRECLALKKVDFKGCVICDDKGLARIPEMLCDGCKALEEVLGWPVNNFDVTGSAFNGAAFRELVIPDQAISADQRAFYGLTKLTTLSIQVDCGTGVL